MSSKPSLGSLRHEILYGVLLPNFGSFVLQRPITICIDTPGFIIIYMHGDGVQEMDSTNCYFTFLGPFNAGLEVLCLRPIMYMYCTL